MLSCAWAQIADGAGHLEDQESMRVVDAFDVVFTHACHGVGKGGEQFDKSRVSLEEALAHLTDCKRDAHTFVKHVFAMATTILRHTIQTPQRQNLVARTDASCESVVAKCTKAKEVARAAKQESWSDITKMMTDWRRLAVEVSELPKEEITKAQSEFRDAWCSVWGINQSSPPLRMS